MHFKRICAAALALAVVSASGIPAYAAGAGETFPYSGTASSNHAAYAGMNSWPSPVTSYLHDNGNGTFTRVEYLAAEEKVLVEIFGTDGKVSKKTTLPLQLQKWGGCFFGSTANYLVFGSDNPNEDENAEVLRVVKYDQNWAEQAVCALNGLNTYEVFFGGSLRMTEAAGTLYLHTCHSLFGIDSVHHQANMTLAINEESMECAQSLDRVSNTGHGYISHSFNQFAAADSESLYRADLGDAYDRGVVLSKAPLGDILDCKHRTVLEIGSTYNEGGNATGVKLGGLGIGTENVLTSGATVDQSAESWSATGQMNIFVTVTEKADIEKGSSKTVFLTDYAADADVSVGVPFLTAVGEDQFALLWEETAADNTAVKYAEISGSGEILLDIMTLPMQLSDCQPILTDSGCIAWYVTDQAAPTVYQINRENLLIYDFDEKTGTLTIIGNTAIPDYGKYGGQPWADVRDQIKKVEIGDGITAIGNNAFSECTAMTSVRIPDSVTAIGEKAFNNCAALNSIRLPENLETIAVRAFYGCKKLRSIIIPESVKTVGKNAFDHCEVLSYVKVLSRECEFENNSVFYCSKNSDFPGEFRIYKGAKAEESFNRYSDTVFKNTFLTYLDDPRVGDINTDDQIDVTDAQLALGDYVDQISDLPSSFSEAQKISADVSQDGSVTIDDAQKILLYYTDWMIEKPVTMRDYME